MSGLTTRQDATQWNANTWYTFTIAGQPAYSLSAGHGRDTAGAINMTDFGTTSSENWQIFTQDGRIFLRNWDYGSPQQFGLPDGKKVPAVTQRNGGLGQQWQIKKVDGGYHIVNMKAGNDSLLAWSGYPKVPSFDDQGGNTLWNITRNESAEKTGPKDNEMYTEVKNVESIPQPTPSASPSSSQSPSSSIASLNPSTSPTSSALTTPPPTLASSSSGLSTGAIAGLAIGIVALLALCGAALWFFLRQRRRYKNVSSTSSNPYEAPGHAAAYGGVGGGNAMGANGGYGAVGEMPYTDKYAHISEAPVTPAELPGVERGLMGGRAELGGSDGSRVVRK